MEIILDARLGEPDGIMQAIETAITLLTSIQSIEGIVDCGDYEPATEAIRLAYDEMNFFRLDGEAKPRIYVDHLLEGYQSKLIKNPPNGQRAYLVSATLARMDESLQNIPVIEFGNHIQAQMQLTKVEDLARKDKSRILRARYDELHNRYGREMAMGGDTPRISFLKWVNDSLEEVLWVLKVGSSIAEAVILWYGKCIEQYITLSDAGVFDLERLPTPEFESRYYMDDREYRHVHRT